MHPRTHFFLKKTRFLTMFQKYVPETHLLSGTDTYEAFHHSLPKNLQNSTFQAFYGPPSNAMLQKNNSNYQKRFGRVLESKKVLETPKGFGEITLSAL